MANYQIVQRTHSLTDIEKGVKNKWVWGWCESPDANSDLSFRLYTENKSIRLFNLSVHQEIKLATETGEKRTETTCQEASAHQYAASRAGFSNAISSF